MCKTESDSYVNAQCLELDSLQFSVPRFTPRECTMISPEPPPQAQQHHQSDRYSQANTQRLFLTAMSTFAQNDVFAPATFALVLTTATPPELLDDLNYQKPVHQGHLRTGRQQRDQSNKTSPSKLRAFVPVPARVTAPSSAGGLHRKLYVP